MTIGLLTNITHSPTHHTTLHYTTSKKTLFFSISTYMHDYTWHRQHPAPLTHTHIQSLTVTSSPSSHWHIYQPHRTVTTAGSSKRSSMYTAPTMYTALHTCRHRHRLLSHTAWWHTTHNTAWHAQTRHTHKQTWHTGKHEYTHSQACIITHEHRHTAGTGMTHMHKHDHLHRHAWSHMTQAAPSSTHHTPSHL
jgi:hypothetical protein